MGKSGPRYAKRQIRVFAIRLTAPLGLWEGLWEGEKGVWVEKNTKKIKTLLFSQKHWYDKIWAKIAS